MNILASFDYVFYRIASYYGDKSPGIVFLSLAQSANFLILWDLICLPVKGLEKIPVIIVLGLSWFLLIVVNAIRYKRYILFDDLSNRWQEEEGKLKAKKGLYLILYIVISMLLFILTSNLSRIITQ